jgi:hypothetical protein
MALIANGLYDGTSQRLSLAVNDARMSLGNHIRTA